MKRLKDIDVAGKRVLVRCDFNVPLDKAGNITDDFRIQQTIPTLEHLLLGNAKIILMSHLGDPKGKVVQFLNMDRVQEKLLEYLDVSVTKAQDCVGKEVLDWTNEMESGEVLLLENLRFHKEEEENNSQFARALALLGDLYVNDAFSVCHRNHASVNGVPQFLPAFAGLLLEKEIQGLERLLKNPERPVLALVGGRKIESKLPLIDKISQIADWVLLGNLLAQELKDRGMKVKYPEKVLLPLDGVPGQGKEFDIGPKTRELFEEKIQDAKTIFWAGPLGKYEEPEYALGSLAVADSILEHKSYAVAGGGNLLDLLSRYHLREKFDHVSTGGSSMLAFLAGEKLPGLKALSFYGN